MRRVIRNYCRECDWSADRATYDQEELARRAVDHATEHGHDIDSEVSYG